MFYCHTKFPDVKYSMQANLLGLVQPEDLTSHINDAVYTGGNRIGQVDMAYMKANHTSCCATWQKNKVSHQNQLGQPSIHFAIQS
jgi:hypothetical protein